MISLLTPEDQFPSPEQTVNHLILEALVKKFGEVPPLDVIEQHLVQVQETGGTTHYVWLDKEPEVGDNIDMSQVVLTIPAPKKNNHQN